MKTPKSSSTLSTWLRPPAPKYAWIWSGVLCSAFTVALCRAQEPHRNFEHISAGLIEAERVVVKSQDGTSIEMGVLDNGPSDRSAGLILRDANGVARAALRFFEGAPRLEMSGADGELALDLWVERDGVSGLQFLHDKSPRVSLTSHAEKGSSALFTDENGRETTFPK